MCEGAGWNQSSLRETWQSIVKTSCQRSNVRNVLGISRYPKWATISVVRVANVSKQSNRVPPDDEPNKSCKASPPPESYANFDSIPYKKSFPNNSANSKPGRAMPPRVDTFAASMLIY